jgi:aminomethyltransferase
MLVTAPDGGIVNDPVLLHVAENRWWMQLADSDAGLYALGRASASDLDVEVSYPHAYPMQVQGAKAAATLEKLVGPEIYDLKYYWCDWFEVAGIPVLISRTGWTAVQGFEINLLDPDRGDDLWDAVFAAGEEHKIRAVAPVEGRRIEAGIMNWGSDFTWEDTPLHIMGLEHLVEDQPQDYVGKAALEALKASGVDRKLVGIEWPGEELRAELTWFWPVVRDGAAIGRVTDAVWSPRLERNIGYAWVPVDLATPGTALDVESEQGPLTVTTATIPFIDPKKEVPAQDLRRG